MLYYHPCIMHHCEQYDSSVTRRVWTVAIDAQGYYQSYENQPAQPHPAGRRALMQLLSLDRCSEPAQSTHIAS